MKNKWSELNRHFDKFTFKKKYSQQIMNKKQKIVTKTKHSEF